MTQKRLGANQFDVNAVAGVTFTIGAESGGTKINVGLQLTDTNGVDVAVACSLKLYLSDDAAGQTGGSAHSTSPAILVDGLLQVLITDVCWLGTFEADGDMSIDFVDSGAQTVYLNVVLPDGRIVTSDAITHAG